MSQIKNLIYRVSQEKVYDRVCSLYNKLLKINVFFFYIPINTKSMTSLLFFRQLKKCYKCLKIPKLLMWIKCLRKAFKLFSKILRYYVIVKRFIKINFTLFHSIIDQINQFSHLLISISLNHNCTSYLWGLFFMLSKKHSLLNISYVLLGIEKEKKI